MLSSMLSLTLEMENKTERYILPFPLMSDRDAQINFFPEIVVKLVEAKHTPPTNKPLRLTEVSVVGVGADSELIPAASEGMVDSFSPPIWFLCALDPASSLNFFSAATPSSSPFSAASPEAEAEAGPGPSAPFPNPLLASSPLNLLILSAMVVRLLSTFTFLSLQAGHICSTLTVFSGWARVPSHLPPSVQVDAMPKVAEWLQTL